MSTKKSTSSRTPVDEDNLYEILYHMLWNKDGSQPTSILPVFIPDTVLFRPGAPIAWYFSDSSGVMKRKSEANLNIPKILETFLKKKSQYGIVAYYIYISDTIKEEDEVSDHHDQETIIEYYDEEAFRKLLSNPNQLKKGILQRFIDPQGERNSMIQCVWTRRICMFNRRTNYKLLKDTNANIYEKFVTFEGPAHMSEATALKGTALSVKLKQALDFIVGHISSATFEKYQVAKLVCYLKVDKDNRIWYLYSGFFRVSRQVLEEANQVSENFRQDTDPLDLNTNLKIPSHIYIGGAKVGSRSSKAPETLDTCPRCSQIYSRSNFVEVSYKLIMEAAEKPGLMKSAIEEFDHTPDVGMMLAPEDPKEVDKENKQLYRVRNKQATIPYIIRKMHPKMKAHEYEKIKNEDYFKIKKTNVCYSCYFQLSKTHNYGGNERNPYKVREKRVNSRPTGQTLNFSEKLKEADWINTQTGSTSQRWLPSRTNSAVSFDVQRANSANRRTFNKHMINRRITEDHFGMSSNSMRQYKDKEEILQSEFQQNSSDFKALGDFNNGGPSFFDVKKAELEVMSKPNIFNSGKSGGILRLGSLMKRTKSVENSKFSTLTSFVKDVSLSRKQSINHTEALYKAIKASQEVENDSKDDPLDTEKNSKYGDKKGEFYSNGQYGRLSANVQNGNSGYGLPELGSLSERLPHDNLRRGSMGRYSSFKDKVSSSDLKKAASSLYASQMNRVNGFSMQNKPAQHNYFDHANDTLKVYFGKNPDRVLVNRSASLMKFLHHGASAVNHKPKVNPKITASRRKLQSTEKQEAFVIDLKAMDAELEGDWYERATKPIPFGVKPETKILITATEQSQSGNIPPTMEFNDQIKEPLNSSSGVQVTKQAQEDESDNQKAFEHTQISQFPHMKVNTISHSKPSQSMSRSKDNAMRISHDEEKGERLTTDLDYSNTQFMKSSLLAKENITAENHRESGDNFSVKDIKPHANNIEEDENEEMSLRTLTKQDFKELTVKPFSTKKESLKSLTTGSKVASKRNSCSAISENINTDDKAESNIPFEEEKISENYQLSKRSSFNNIDKKSLKSMESIKSESKDIISYNLTQEHSSTIKETDERKSLSRKSTKREIESHIPSSCNFTEHHTETDNYDYDEEVFEEIEG